MKSASQVLILITILLVRFSSEANSSEFYNLDLIKSNLGFTKYYNQTSQIQKKLKVAILDKGFTNHEKHLGSDLPKNTKYIQGPVNTPINFVSEHGTVMARLFNNLLTNSNKNKNLEPELYLFNTYGFSNFKFAVEECIRLKVDLILYTEVWEYGGNNDGQGFINSIVDKAVNSGIIWINAAGNFSGLTFNTIIETNENSEVLLPNKNNSLKIICTPNKNNNQGSCQSRIVLSWNDFKDQTEIGTDKDLNIELYDSEFNQLASSKLIQTKNPNENRPGYSKYSREILNFKLPEGTHYLRVINQSQNFNKSDTLRITVDGDGLILPNGEHNNSILNPADNPGVITVGSTDSERSSYSLTYGKPDIITSSSILLNNGMEFRGSSNSATIVAAGIGLLKTLNSSLNKNQILDSVTLSSWKEDLRGLNDSQLGFTSTKECFENSNLNNTQAYITKFYALGAVLVDTTAGARLMLPYDPTLLDTKLAHSRKNSNDMILSTPFSGLILIPRSQSKFVTIGSVELFQAPQNTSLCQKPHKSIGKYFYLQ